MQPLLAITWSNRVHSAWCHTAAYPSDPQWTKIHSTRIQLAALFFHAYTHHRHPIILVLVCQPRDRIQMHRRFSERATYHIRLGGTQKINLLAKFLKGATPCCLRQIRKMAAYMSAINIHNSFRVALKPQTVGIHMTILIVLPMSRTHPDLNYRSPRVEPVC